MNWIRMVTIAASATMIASTAGSAWAQHGGHAEGHSHHQIDDWAKEFEAVVGGGRGFGMAFAADQNGYPGPMHVLELKDSLNITPEQEAKLRAVVESMFAEARPKSTLFLEREQVSANSSPGEGPMQPRCGPQSPRLKRHAGRYA